MEEHKAYLNEIGGNDEKLRNFSNENFFQIVKNRLEWKPNYYKVTKDADLKGLEKALRDRGDENFVSRQLIQSMKRTIHQKKMKYIYIQ